MKLTPRQTEFLVHAANGMQPPQIAERCTVSIFTVHNTLRSARERLGARNLAQAAARAVSYELIVVDDSGVVRASTTEVRT